MSADWLGFRFNQYETCWKSEANCLVGNQQSWTYSNLEAVSYLGKVNNPKAVSFLDMTQRDNSSHLQMLLHRVLAKEDGAFDEFTMATTDRLRNLAHSMLRRYPHVRRWEDTNDVMQAALIRLHQSINEVQPESTREFFGLAATQIRRSLIDLARHYYGVYGVGTKHHSQGGGKAADDSGGLLLNSGTDDRPDSLEAWTGFHEAIDLLPDDEKEVFSLVWYGGLMQKEVANLLGVAEKTVMRRMTRARIRLHEILADQQPEME